MQLMTAREFMETGLEAEDGYCLAFLSMDEAKKFRMLCYTTRSRQRARNEKMYIDDGDYVPHTKYDALTFDLEEKQGAVLLVVKHKDLYLQHTRHGPVSKEAMEKLRNGEDITLDEIFGKELEVDNPSPVDEVSEVDNALAAGEGVDNG